MNCEEPFLESLRQSGRVAPEFPIEVDVSARVLQMLRQRAPETQKAFPMTVLVVCLIALGCGAAAQQSLSTVTDPISAVFSPVQVDLQW